MRFVFVGCNQDNQEKQDWDRSRSHQDQKGDSNHVLCSASQHYPHLWRYCFCHLMYIIYFIWIPFSVFENKEKMVLVMEIAAGGELYDYLSERKTLEEKEARRVFRQIATAVFYCHKVSCSFMVPLIQYYSNWSKVLTYEEAIKLNKSKFQGRFLSFPSVLSPWKFTDFLGLKFLYLVNR